MTIPADTKTKTRPDGSIDTSFYMARGRVARSEAAHGMLRALTRPSPDTAKTRKRVVWRIRLALG